MCKLLLLLVKRKDYDNVLSCICDYIRININSCNNITIVSNRMLGISIFVVSNGIFGATRTGFLCNKALGVGFELNPHILEFILLAQICKS